MKERKRKQKNIIIGGLVAIVFLLSVGYAAFASNLTINGTANTSSWIIKITDIREKTKTGGADTVTTSYTDLSASFSTTLVQPGDSITYEVTVENQGNIDAALKQVTKTYTNSRYIDVTYDGLLEGQMLYKQGQTGSTAKMLVTITFKDIEIESLTQDKTSNITISLDFKQEGNNVDPTTKYLVEYDTLGGSQIESRYFGWDEYGLAEPRPTKLGYDFGGWFATSKSGGEVAIVASKRLSDLIDETDEGITLRGSWAPKRGYIINYNSQGGNEIASSNNIWTDRSLTESATKEGYTFEGWYTEPNGKGMEVTNQTLMSDLYQYVYGVGEDDTSRQITLYANWTETIYTIIFSSKGGNAVPSQTIKWSDTIESLPTPTREGYTFAGWYTGWNTKTKTVKGTKVEIGMTFSQIGSSSGTGIILYAKWTANS